MLAPNFDASTQILYQTISKNVNYPQDLYKLIFFGRWQMKPSFEEFLSNQVNSKYTKI